MTDKNVPELITRDFGSLLKAAPMHFLFREPLTRLAFEDRARASALLQAIEKSIKDRRTAISKSLEKDIEDGKVKDFDLMDSGEKSTKVEIPGVSLRRTVSGGGKSPNQSKVQSLLESKGLDSSNVLEPVGEAVDLDALKAYLDAEGIPYSKFIKPRSFNLNEPVLKALNTAGVISTEELDSVYEDVPSKVTLSCTLDGDLKKSILSDLSALEE